MKYKDKNWKSKDPRYLGKRKWRESHLERLKELSKKWRENNRERSLENSRRWYENNKERAKKINDEWRKNNIEKVRLYKKKWAKNNPEKVKLKNKEWAKRNKKKVVLKTIRWQTKNPEKVKAERLIRRKPIKSYCEWDGSTENLLRHHPDYSKPYYYITLCARCHAKTKNFKHQIQECKI